VGLFGGGNSKRTTNNETTNFNTSFGIGGDNDGSAISGDSNNVFTTDFGAIKGAFGVVDQVLLGNTETNLAIAGLAAENGANAIFLAETSIAGNQALSESVMNNQALLIDQFGADMAEMSAKNAAISQSAMDNNSALSSQFGADLSSAYSGFGADLSAITESSIIANAQLTSEVNSLVGEISAGGNQTLMEMAEMQSRGLDNALEIAGNISMDDAAEASTNMVKYLSIAAGVVAIAMVFK